MGEAFWARAMRVRRRERKASVHLRIDADVLDWFKSPAICPA
ncbi:MAG TPA: BrnA antitoxin family protein [Methylosinus sp.]